MDALRISRMQKAEADFAHDYIILVHPVKSVVITLIKMRRFVPKTRQKYV